MTKITKKEKKGNRVNFTCFGPSVSGVGESASLNQIFPECLIQETKDVLLLPVSWW